jgi:hypothetical protein
VSRPVPPATLCARSSVPTPSHSLECAGVPEGREEHGSRPCTSPPSLEGHDSDGSWSATALGWL